MTGNAVYCDECGHEIKDDYLEVSQSSVAGIRKGLGDSHVELLREHHFCGFKCLIEWAASKARK
jgi:hypothetical protein